MTEKSSMAAADGADNGGSIPTIETVPARTAHVEGRRERGGARGSFGLSWDGRR